MASRYRPRRQFRFLLYQDIAMELTLTDYILKLKASKQFVTTIKNALRLIGSLQERDLSVLYELFPWIGEAIQASAPTPPDTSGLEDRLAKRLEASVAQAIMNAPGLPSTPLVAAPIKHAAPVASIKQAAKADASTIADNFFSSFQ
jgi:hypothetical protein